MGHVVLYGECGVIWGGLCCYRGDAVLYGACGVIWEGCGVILYNVLAPVDKRVRVKKSQG